MRAGPQLLFLPGALYACPIGSLQAVLDSGSFKVSCYVFGLLMAFGVLLGRFVCGWLCPFGLVQDLLHKLPLPSKRKNMPGDRYLRKLKYLVLALFVILLPALARDGLAGVHLAAFGYVFADCIRFLTRMGMMTLPELVFASVLTAFDLAAVLLTLRYAWYCARRGIQDDRVQALYPTLPLALAMHGIYFVLDIIILFLPVFENLVPLQPQVFFSVFLFLLPDAAVTVVLIAVADSARGKPAAPPPVPTPAQRAERRRALLRAVKAPALWSALAAVSIAYIFSGEHSMAALRTDAFTDFTAAEVAGGPVDESIFADHDLTLVNIWATFCGPCLSEMPDLARLHAEYRDRGFQVVGVCGDIVDMNTGAVYPDLVAKALELERQTGADAYLNLDPAGDLMQNYIGPTVAAYPTSVFVNSRGEQVGDMIVGSCDEARWRQEIESRLAEVAAQTP